MQRSSALGATVLAGALCAFIGGSTEARPQSLRKGDLIAGPATVADGKSLDIKSNRIRLWGIDVPDRGQGCFRNGRRWKPAREAAAALRQCVAGKTVTCRVWRVEQEWFRQLYVSECWTDDGLDVAGCMVRGGWASDHTCFSDGYYRDLETEAKNKGLGLWSCDNGPGTRRWGRKGPGAACEVPRYRPTGPK